MSPYFLVCDESLPACEWNKWGNMKTDLSPYEPSQDDPYFINNINSPFVITIHDMIPELYPEFFITSDDFKMYKKILAKKASKIIAISNNTKKDIIELYNIDEKKVDVVYHGNSLVYTNEQRDHFIKGMPKYYLLYVGNRDLYKNFYFSSFIKG